MTLESPSHCFVVPAYGDSPYLPDCLKSLADQSLSSSVVVTTPTPNARIERAVREYGASLRVNAERRGIGADWNFALQHAEADWITIAHQDDIYLPQFAEKTMSMAMSRDDMTLVFTDYAEQLDDRTRRASSLLRIKRALLELAFVGGTQASRRFWKTNALRFGCAIPCPAVTIHRPRTGLRFREDLRVDLDWAAWLELARRPGAFGYVREVLMLHRVHASSETTAGIGDGTRAAEDRALLRMMWPRFFADAIAGTYGIAYRSNRT